MLQFIIIAFISHTARVRVPVSTYLNIYMLPHQQELFSLSTHVWHTFKEPNKKGKYLSNPFCLPVWLNFGCIFTKTYLHCTNANTHSYLCTVHAVKCNILTSIQLRDSLWTHSDCVHTFFWPKWRPWDVSHLFWSLKTQTLHPCQSPTGQQPWIHK